MENESEEQCGLKAGAIICACIWVGIVIIAVLLLAGCSNRIENHSQAPAMEREGLKAQKYTLGMDLVPCIRWKNNDPINGYPIPLTVKERVAIQKAKGGYLADCGVVDNTWVWGKTNERQQNE